MLRNVGKKARSLDSAEDKHLGNGLFPHTDSLIFLDKPEAPQGPERSRFRGEYGAASNRLAEVNQNQRGDVALDPIASCLRKRNGY